MLTPWQLKDAMASHKPGPWLQDALCAQVGPVDFFPGKCESAEPAKRICRLCDVQTECLLYAVTSPTALQGIWGGKSATERREMRRTAGIEDQEWIEDWHGTERGEQKHRRAGEKPCDPCRRAASDTRRVREQRRLSC